jgi:hypothetical protein
VVKFFAENFFGARAARRTHTLRNFLRRVKDGVLIAHQHDKKLRWKEAFRMDLGMVGIHLRFSWEFGGDCCSLRIGSVA